VTRRALAAAFVIALPLSAGTLADPPAGKLLFSRGDDIWLAEVDGSHARRVAGGPGPQDDPSWAPDGRRFVYRDSQCGGREKIFNEVFGSEGGGVCEEDGAVW